MSESSFGDRASYLGGCEFWISTIAVCWQDCHVVLLLGASLNSSRTFKHRKSDLGVKLHGLEGLRSIVFSFQPGGTAVSGRDAWSSSPEAAD